jgi:hypothetical protein
LDARWDEARAAIDDVSSQRGALAQKVDAGCGNAYQSSSPLDGPWVDVRTAINNVAASTRGVPQRKGDAEAKKKGRAVGRSKASIVGIANPPFNSK